MLGSKKNVNLRMTEDEKNFDVQVIDFDFSALKELIGCINQSQVSKDQRKLKRRKKSDHNDLVISDLHYAGINEYYHNNQGNDDFPIENKWIEVARENLNLLSESPVLLSDIISDIDPSVGTNDKIEIRTEDLKVYFESNDSLLCMKTKPNLKMRSKRLFSINVLSNEKLSSPSFFQSLKRCISTLNISNAKMKLDCVMLNGPDVCISFLPDSNQIHINLSFAIYLKGGVFNYIPPEMRYNLSFLILDRFVSKPNVYEKHFDSINPEEPINPQLFYKVLSENALSFPHVNRNFDIPELETNLLRFQKKTVNWLLNKEGMEYNWDTNRCERRHFISEKVIRNLKDIQNGLDIDMELLDHEVQIILNRISYGWRRYIHGDEIYWYNRYSGNIDTQEGIYTFILNYYESKNKERLPLDLPAQGLLAEEMGLGKTVEISALVLLNPRPIDEVNEPIKLQLHKFGGVKTLYKSKTTLIIAPDSILKQWVEEMYRLAPSLAVTIYSGMNKYPEFENNARLIVEYLKKFDIVFTTYSTISRELDYALYSTRGKQTRNTRKRNTDIAEGMESLHRVEKSAGDTKDSEDNSDENWSNAFSSFFQISLKTQKPAIANVRSNNEKSDTDFELALKEEIRLAIEHNQIPDIYKSQDYENPLMLMQFWRVVLDEVQMVSSKVSRAFQSASLIPRYHAWGVSGTPIKKDFNDLLSILKFLRVNPFVNDFKFCWPLVSNMSERFKNEDFVQLWSLIALRHTKAAVHDDIRLPPQKRILMTIPFTPVEQENYNEMLENCLAAICLDSNGNPVLSDWEPTPTVLMYMRYWLVKLRQICGNPQIGKLNISSRKYKLKNNSNSTRIVTTAQLLKTLENVLEDMLEKTVNQILNSENGIIQEYADVSQLLEYILMPEKALALLTVGCRELEKITARLEFILSQKIYDYKEFRSRHNLSPILSEDDIEVNDDEFANEEGNMAMAANLKESLASFKDQIKSTKLKIRSHKVLLHKFYFLLASSHFQCYDEEYRKKINDLRVEQNSKVEAVNALANSKRNTDEISLLITGCQIQSKSKEEAFRNVDIDLINDGAERHKILELSYYHAAEITRREILKSPILLVNKAVASKFSSRTQYNSSCSEFIDDGLTTIPKTSKKLFTKLPIIKIDALSEFVVGMKSRLFLEKIANLVANINQQCLFINECMSDLISILSKPLLDEEKSPSGEEYENSIEDQDKASCYLHTVAQLLNDRNEFIIGKDVAIKTTVFKENEEKNLEAELKKLNNVDFMEALQEKRDGLRNRSKFSLQDLIMQLKDDELELRDENYGEQGLQKLEVDTFHKLITRLRNIFENQKLSQVLLQKELNLSCNFVFNSRIEYFKQLQQISDSVQPQKFSFLQDNIDIKALNKQIDQHMNKYMSLNSSIGKFIAKFRYLLTLVRKDEDTSKKKEEDEELMCIICRSMIIIGSLTQCGHKYCKECLDQWLQNQKTCPMCKSAISYSSVYNFTHHKPDLKAKEMRSDTAISKIDSLNSIYGTLDQSTLDEIQLIPLKNLYSSKVDIIVKQVLYLKDKDSSVQIVIFSQWQDLLYIIGTALKSANVSFIGSHGTLTPEVGVGRKRTKYDSVEEFKDKRNGITCFLLNARAQASGLTLVNATHMILCEPLVNTSLELQAISRIHRIGQTHETTVWMFAIENTVEESIVVMTTNKRLENLGDKTDTSFQERNGDKANGASGLISSAKEKNLTKAESITLMKSGGIDSMITRSNSEGEMVTNSDLWNAFFSASSLHPYMNKNSGTKT